MHCEICLDSMPHFRGLKKYLVRISPYVLFVKISQQILGAIRLLQGDCEEIINYELQMYKQAELQKCAVCRRFVQNYCS